MLAEFEVEKKTVKRKIAGLKIWQPSEARC